MKAEGGQLEEEGTNKRKKGGKRVRWGGVNTIKAHII
jgi:hypothetical protein